MKLMAVLGAFLLLAAAAGAQELPSRIRGYKVHRADITVAGETVAGKTPDVLIKLGTISFSDLALLGATVEISIDITSNRYAGRVDRVMFRDFEFGGIGVDVEEYTHSFAFKKGETIRLPSAARVVLPLTSVTHVPFSDLWSNAEYLNVTGTAFVFGSFKKHGFRFKRVVPVQIDLKIANPLRL